MIFGAKLLKAVSFTGLPFQLGCNWGKNTSDGCHLKASLSIRTTSEQGHYHYFFPLTFVGIGNLMCQKVEPDKIVSKLLL